MELQGGAPSGRIPTYATIAAFPPAASDGALAVALDSDRIYTFDANTLTWKYTGQVTDHLDLINRGTNTHAQIDSFIASKAQASGLASLGSDGFVPLGQMNPSALERLIIVANQTARFALTTATAQNGDTVKETDTGLMYYVKDDTNLGNASGYAVYAAGTAASVPWTGITGVPAPVSALSGTNTGDITLAAVGAVPNANAASLTGQVLTLQPASTTQPGVILAAAQTISGRKVIQAQTDNVPLTLQGSAAQTANLQEWKNSTGTVLSALDIAGKLGVGKAAPTALLDLAAGTTTIAALKFTSGAFLTALQAGAVAFDGTDLYFTTTGPVRRQIDAPDALKYTPILFDDFISDTSAGNIGWSEVHSGVGSSATVTAAGSEAFNAAMGSISLNTGTGINGRDALHLGQTMGFGYGLIQNRWRVIVAVLSTGVETFSAMFGYGDTPAGAGIGQTHAIRFIYDTAISLNWVCETMAAGVSTQTITSVPVSTSWVKLDITVNASTNIVFAINGVTVATHTTNMPGFIQWLGPLMKIGKSLGITSRSVYVDYFWQKISWTGTR